MNARWRTVVALAFLLALTVGFYRQLTLSTGDTWLENPDQALQVRPWLDFEAREIHAGRLPLWDPYQIGGQSLIGQVQPGLANPLNWLLFAMPLQDGHIPLGVLHWYWVLIHWAAVIFCYALCRDLKAGIGASLVGASVWAFAGFMGHSGTPQFLMSALWIPVVLLFFARVFRGHRPRASAALCGVAMGLAFLSGHHNIPIYTAVLLGGLWLWYVVSPHTVNVRQGVVGQVANLRPIVNRPADTVRDLDAQLSSGPTSRPTWPLYWQRIVHALIFLAVCFLVSAVQMLPAIEYGRRAVRWAGTPEPQHWKDRIPYSVHAEYSLHARSIPGMVIPGLTVHANPFVGIVALSLALTAIYLGWRSRRVRLMATVALGGLLLALGADSPVHRIAYLLIPMVEKARYPAMAVVISQAGIAALAALGLDAFRRVCFSLPNHSKGAETSEDSSPASVSASGQPQSGEDAYPTKTTVSWLGGFALSVFAIYGALALVHRAPTAHPTWIIGAVALALAAVLQWWPRRRYAWSWGLPAAVLALFFIESTTVPLPIQRQNQPDSLLKPVAEEADIAEFLHRQPGWFRVQIDEDEVPVNFGDFYGIEQFGGYVASMPANILTILGDQRTPRWFGVQFYVGRKPANPQQVEVFQSRTGLKVYRNPGIQEPLRAEHDTPCGTDDHLRVASRAPNAMAIEADLGCAGRVVAGDPWFPGWRAWVDGKRVRIQESAGVVRAVPVAAGHHQIEFQYQPGSVYWGAGLSALGVLLAGMICYLDRPDTV